MKLKGWKKIPSAAEYYGVSARTMRELVKQGFPHAKLPTGTVIVDLERGDEMLRSNSGKGSDKQIIDDLLSGMV